MCKRKEGSRAHGSLVTAVFDGIGLQLLLDPSIDVVGSIGAYVTRTITG